VSDVRHVHAAGLFVHETRAEVPGARATEQWERIQA
jgi:hypothetical protein